MSHRYLVLGLLAQAPMTGYEIKKHASCALRSVANASYGTLYPMLHQLLDEGAVQMEEYPQNHRPARKVYTITERGKQELAAWLHEPAQSDQIRRDFLLKLFLAHDLSPDDLRLMLQQRRAATEAELAALREIQSAVACGTPPNQLWVSDYTLTMCQAELEWLDRLMAQMGPDRLE